VTIEVLVATLALVTALIVAAVNAAFQRRLRMLESNLTEEAQEQAILDRYQEPLVRAAYELQSRLFNIVRQEFLQRYPVERDGGLAATYAVNSTVWLVAQYFCWVEILRQEIQFVRLDDQRQTLHLQKLLDDIAHTFGSDSLDDPLRVFRSHQSAIGELMIIDGRDAAGQPRSECLGFAGFVERLEDPKFARWFAALRDDVPTVAGRDSCPRLVQIQHLLVDFIDAVDPPPGVRFTRARSKTPAAYITP